MVKNAVIIIRTAYKITNYSVWTCQQRLNVSILYYATKQTVTTDHQPPKTQPVENQIVEKEQSISKKPISEN